MTNKNAPLNYYQTLTEVFWPLRLKNLNKYYKWQKNEMATIFKKNNKIRVVQIL